MSTSYFKSALAFVILLQGSVHAQDYKTDTGVQRKQFSWPEGKKMAISLTFDDARYSQADLGIPVLNKYNVKATFYISPDNAIERLDKWKKAVSDGHEIGNHLVVHPCMENFEFARNKGLENYSTESLRNELDSANKFIFENFGVNAFSFAYPCGQTYTGRGTSTKSYVPLIAGMFETGRGWLGESQNDPLYCNMSQITGIELDGKSFEQVLELIETGLDKGTWLVLAGHETNDSGRQTSLLNTIGKICEYASNPANGIWIDNVHNVARYIREKRGEAAFARLPLYKDPTYPVQRRTEDLLSRMTLEEKIGQLNMPCVYVSQLGRDKASKAENCRLMAEGSMKGFPGPSGGFFTLANTILHDGTRQQAEYFNELQKIAVEKTRLGIPLLQTEEGTHGLMCTGGTIFPEGLALGSTWNMKLIDRIYTIAAREARSVGIHQLFTLVVEPYRDPRLGRSQEGYSEDPFLCSRMAETIVHAVQGDDVSAVDKTVAGLCHYPGQSEPVSGMERGAMEISERKLREVFLPPWIAGIKKAGALGVMATYPAVDGIPTHGSEFLLTRILREELGFKGLVLSEGGGLETLYYMGLASNGAETGELAIKAGLDVGISYEDGFIDGMIENVRSGKVPVQLIDRSVRRVLEQKYRMGLFENPFTDPDKAVKTVHTTENREAALEAAREGIVLLKNEGNILPVTKKLKRIAVIGPNADNEKNQLGDYTAIVVSQEITTVLEGIRNAAGNGTTVEFIKGCDVIDDNPSEIPKAVKASKSAELAIVVLGENEWRAAGKKGTSGEGYDVANLDLTGRQEELLKAVANTGTPVILVLINGRPLSIRWASENIPAIIEAWCPGEAGGQAVADIIFGKVNPSGKLSVTIPRHSGQLPVYYNYMPDKEHWIKEGWGKAYADMPASPLWVFGHGLSYTSFEYSNLEIKPVLTGTSGEITIGLDVRNSGKREGKEVVQLYIRDEIASVTTPVKELKGFEKIHLEPGETKHVEFRLNADDLALYDRNMNRLVEPGKFLVMTGSSSGDIRLKGEFSLE